MSDINKNKKNSLTRGDRVTVAFCLFIEPRHEGSIRRQRTGKGHCGVSTRVSGPCNPCRENSKREKRILKKEKGKRKVSSHRKSAVNNHFQVKVCRTRPERQTDLKGHR
jgi:hypothetical protein